MFMIFKVEGATYSIPGDYLLTSICQVFVYTIIICFEFNWKSYIGEFEHITMSEWFSRGFTENLMQMDYM